MRPMGIFGWIIVICLAVIALCLVATAIFLPLGLLLHGFAALKAIFSAPAKESSDT